MLSDDLKFGLVIWAMAILDWLLGALVIGLLAGCVSCLGPAPSPVVIEVDDPPPALPSPPSVTPAPVSDQAVYLDFRGGTGYVSWSVYNLGEGWSGDHEFIQAALAEDYPSMGFHLAPPAIPFSTLYFGGTATPSLGRATQDHGNLDPSDTAVIFTGNYYYYFPMLDEAEITQMIANTAAHELGHLIGLVHTDDPNDVMAGTPRMVPLTRNLAIHWDDQDLTQWDTP